MSEHTKYRQTKEWKSFRAGIIQQRGTRCECCGIHKASRGLQLHHLDPEHYENLDETKFALLCNDCHKLVEKIAKRLAGKKADTVAHRELWISLLGPYLPLIKYAPDSAKELFNV